MNQLIEDLKNKLNATLIETHISYVLVNDIVYKIKKSVNFGFLDFTTLEKRKFYCEKEIELNKRFSPDLYIGIVTITKDSDGFSISGRGEIVEYAVVMKKLEQDKMMDSLLEKDAVSLNDIDKLASIIANFHKNAQTNPQISQFGEKENIKINTDENFNQTFDAQGSFLTKHQFEAIKNYTNDFLDSYDWKKRINEQKIRDCHGDLYSHNICIADKIYIYDCIEFNDRFRYSDVASDVAFLVMDLEFHNKYKLAEFFLQKYIEYSNDYTIKEVLDFYKTYRAYVRGKIHYFENNVELSSRYFDLSYKYIDQKYKPTLVAMVGLTGCGKSYFADKLAKKLNAKVFASDVIRKQMFSGKTDGFEEGIYSAYHTQKVYEKLDQLAYESLKEGFSVILDATYTKRAFRQNLVEKISKLGIKVNFVFLDTDEKTILQNLQTRQKQKSISDGTVDVYFKQKATFEKPQESNVITIHSNNDESLNHVYWRLKNETWD